MHGQHISNSKSILYEQLQTQKTGKNYLYTVPVPVYLYLYQMAQTQISYRLPVGWGTCTDLQGAGQNKQTNKPTLPRLDGTGAGFLPAACEVGGR